MGKTGMQCVIVVAMLVGLSATSVASSECDRHRVGQILEDADDEEIAEVARRDLGDGQVPHECLVEGVIATIEGTATWRALAATAALGLTDERLVEPILDALGGLDGGLPEGLAALSTQARSSKKVVKRLIKLATSTAVADQGTRREAAIDALRAGRHGYPALPTLLEIARKDPEELMRELAAAAIHDLITLAIQRGDTLKVRTAKQVVR